MLFLLSHIQSRNVLIQGVNLVKVPLPLRPATCTHFELFGTTARFSHTQ